jgi:hypothetical protein
MNHCFNCPVADNLACRGESVPRYCELIDPKNPAYNAAYKDIILQAAEDDVEYPPLTTPVKSISEITDRVIVAGSGEQAAPCGRCPDKLASNIFTQD